MLVAMHADQENVRISERSFPPAPTCDCLEKNRPVWFHVCCMCLDMFRCDQLRRPADCISNLRFCSACQVPAGEILNQRRQRREDRGTLSLLTRLKAAVAHDIKMWHAKDRFVTMDARYENLTARLWSELSTKFRKNEMSAVVWEDAFAAELCGDNTYCKSQTKLSDNRD